MAEAFMSYTPSRLIHHNKKRPWACDSDCVGACSAYPFQWLQPLLQKEKLQQRGQLPQGTIPGETGEGSPDISLKKAPDLSALLYNHNCASTWAL